jgi:hypothetical protein
MSTRRQEKHDAALRPPSYTREEFTAWLAASCERQCVPLTVTDPIVIARVATLLGHHPHRRPRQRAQGGRADGRAEAPDRLDANGIHDAGAGAADRDERVFPDRAHDGVSAVRAHVGPLAA